MEEIEVKEQRVDENLAESNRWRREEKGLMRLREEEDRNLLPSRTKRRERGKQREDAERGKRKCGGEREKVTIKANVQLSHERKKRKKKCNIQ